MIFLLKYASKKVTQSPTHSKLLEDLKNISVYIYIKNEEVAIKIADLLKFLYSVNFSDKENKNLMNIFQIVSSFCIQSEQIKVALNNIGFHETLKESLNKDIFEDTLLQYQAKGCLLNLKQKKVNMSAKLTNSSTLRSMSINLAQVEVKEEVFLFLRSEKTVKM